MAPIDGKHLYPVLITVALSTAVGFSEGHPHNVSAISVTPELKQRKDCPEGEKKEHGPTFSTVT